MHIQIPPPFGATAVSKLLRWGMATLWLCSCSSHRSSPDPGDSGSGGSGGMHSASGGAGGNPEAGLPDDPCELSGADCSGAPPNILFVLMDDVGVDLIGAYGLAPDAPPTPTIDALAQAGFRFTSAYATPWCSPTRAAVLTGRDPAKDFQLGRAIRAENATDVSLPLDAVTLPEALDAGSPTPWGHAHIGKWHLTKLADDPKDAPLRHGYQRFRGAIANPYQRHTYDGQPQDYYDWERSVEGVIERSREYATSRMFQDAIEVVQELPEPWFMCVAPFAAHDPYQAPPSELHSYGDLSEADEATIERAMVEALDRELGRLLASLPEEVRQNTMVIVMGDNGSPSNVATASQRGTPTKGTVYEGGIHVPLIVSGPAVKNPGGTYDGLTHAQDIFATILDLARVPRSKRPAGIESISFLPQLLEPTLPSNRHGFVIEAFEPNGPGPYDIHQIAAFDGRYKLIRDQAQGDLFFDLQGQLVETAPLSLDTLNEAQQVAFDALTAQLAAR